MRTEKTVQDIFLEDLRNQTAESHKALEENEVSKALLSNTLTLADYRNYLVHMYGLVKGIELYAYPKLGGIFRDLNQRKKAHLIEEDLLNTGFSIKEIAAIPIKTFSPVDEASAIGSMYVLEGSTLGGRMLYKHINKQLHLSEGVSFFNGYGNRTGSMWKEFVKKFTDFAVNNNAQEVIHSAIQTFKATGEWMASGLKH